VVFERREANPLERFLLSVRSAMSSGERTGEAFSLVNNWRDGLLRAG
jgi:hypothetical protein